MPAFDALPILGGHERRALQSVIQALRFEVMVSETSQLRVHHRNRPGEGFLVSLYPSP
jgi:hypothetical protein